jgi:hypothetical protein
MFIVLFVYVFGGAISTPGYDYVDFLMPGIITQSIAFGGFVTAIGLNEDLRKGLIDRFRSLPMTRSAVLAGRTLADVVLNTFSLAVMLSVGYLVGFNFDSPGLRDRRRASCCCSCSATRSRGSSRSWGWSRARRSRRSPWASWRSSRSRSRRRRSCRPTRCRTGCRRSRHQPVHDRRQRGAARCGSTRRRTTTSGARFALDDRDDPVFAPLAVRAYRRAAVRA